MIKLILKKKCQNMKEDERFLNELFENLKNTELEVSKRRDMFLFLREYISFLHGLQQAREPLYQVIFLIYLNSICLEINPLPPPKKTRRLILAFSFEQVTVQPRHTVRSRGGAQCQGRASQHHRHRDLLAVCGGGAHACARVHTQGGRVALLRLQSQGQAAGGAGGVRCRGCERGKHVRCGRIRLGSTGGHHRLSYLGRH